MDITHTRYQESPGHGWNLCHGEATVRNGTSGECLSALQVPQPEKPWKMLICPLRELLLRCMPPGKRPCVLLPHRASWTYYNVRLPDCLSCPAVGDTFPYALIT